MTTAPDVHWESWRRLRDPAAFEALVRPELGRALSFARSLGCSDADAEDVLQESLVRLAAERGDGPSRIGVRAWLYRTVRDRARSRRRSWWRRRSREARAARPEAAPPRTGGLEAREQVEQALAALPDAEREAVRLRYLQDLDYRDMAHVLGVSENACRTRVHRALESLKKRFGAGVATMVAALPLPAPTHSEHLLREVLRAAVPAPVAGTVVAAWSILGGGLAAAAALALFLPPWAGAPPLPRTPPVPVPGAPAKRAAASAEKKPVPPEVVTAAQEKPVVSSAEAPGPAATSTVPGGPTTASAVALLAEVASIGWEQGLHASAADVYGTILRIDPAHKTAAERVGTNDRDSVEVGPARKIFDESLALSSKAAAGILSGIGAATAAAGDEKGAKDLWGKALLVDGQDPLANERLGNRLLDGRWISPRGEAHLRFERWWKESLQRCRWYDPPIRPTTLTTGIPENAGIAAIALEGDGLLLETDLPEREGRNLLSALARERRWFEELLDIPVQGRRKGDSWRTRFLVFSSAEVHGRAVDACDRIPPRSKEAAKAAPLWAIPGDPPLVLAPASTDRGFQGVLVKAAAADDVQGVFGTLDSWLADALARVLSVPLCDDRDIVNPSGLRSPVLRNRDLPLSDLVQRVPGDRDGSAKAWSVVLFLLETDRGDAVRFLGDAGRRRKEGKGSKDSAERELGRNFKSFRTWKDLDEAWRAWVLDVQSK